MNNNITKFMVAGLACVAAFTTTFAAPHGGKPGSASRPSAPARQQMKAPAGGHKAHAPSMPKAHNAAPVRTAHAAPAPKTHNFAPKMHHPAPKMHHPAPKMHHPAPTHHAYARHTPPPRPMHHRPCGFLHPRGHHIGGLHIAIVPPTVLIDSYYWTEEVFINGCYYILYCYPDGTKRFADGTIYCYF